MSHPGRALRDSTAHACARPPAALSGGNGPWLLLGPEKARPHPPAAFSLGTSFSPRNSSGSDALFCLLPWPGSVCFIYGSVFEAGPAAPLLFPQPSVAAPFVIASGPCPRGDGSRGGAGAPSRHLPPRRLVLILSLSSRSSPSEEPRWEDHLRRMFSPPRSSL